ncbi:MAG TPA: ATP-binding protein, partial [Tabrizicola sp.]|nr:ATP-binding protein [Tabrizicola sp.]
LDLLRFLHGLQAAADRQVIMATHAPILMALPGASLLQVTRHGFAKVALRDTPHFRLYADFMADPAGFIAEALADPG